MNNKTEEQLLSRIRQAKRAYGLTVADMCKQAGMAKSTVQNQLYGRYKIDIDVLCALLQLCPDLSAEWLMRGNGAMTERSPLTDLLKRVETLEKQIKTLI